MAPLQNKRNQPPRLSTICSPDAKPPAMENNQENKPTPGLSSTFLTALGDLKLSSDISPKKQHFEPASSSIPSPITAPQPFAFQDMSALDFSIDFSPKPQSKRSSITLTSSAVPATPRMQHKRSSLSVTSSNIPSTPRNRSQPHTLTMATEITESLTNQDDRTLSAHLKLLSRSANIEGLDEISTSPIFTEDIRKYALRTSRGAGTKPFSQWGLLGGFLNDDGPDARTGRDDVNSSMKAPIDPRIFLNVSAPSSVFICGSQGSGKSHSLSCLLENCLVRSEANQLPRPLTGLVFHYDTLISDTGGQPCEAAFISSSPDVSVRVLCAPSNLAVIKKIYSQFPNVKVEELRINQSDLNTKRMMELMAVTSSNPPLYIHILKRILRDLRIEQQQLGGTFDYAKFKAELDREDLTEMQRGPLYQRLDTLESFMVQDQASAYKMSKIGKTSPVSNGPVFLGRALSSNDPVAARISSRKRPSIKGSDWAPKARQLTIVDLSCPCITAEMACSLFTICLDLFLEQGADSVGRVVALDEAHKYMTDSAECQTLTESLLDKIRLQRHLAARVFISTQEPTISPKLLDLCSITLVHRFTSPDWLNALKKHLAGLSAASQLLRKIQSNDDDEGTSAANAGTITPITFSGDDTAIELFSRIVNLRVGEALLFAPSAVITAEQNGNIKRLGQGVLKVRIRQRVTDDGGQSIMAT